MKGARLAALKFLALLFLLPGLAGLLVSAMISTHYLATMPQLPDPAAARIVPRTIHGTTIYQTIEEDRNLSAIEYGSVGVFAIGLALSVVFLEKWGAAQAHEMGEEQALADHNL
jgi:hypothetical protein